jgi:hypothetical protein
MSLNYSYPSAGTPITFSDGDVVIIGGIALTLWQVPSEMPMPSAQMLNKHLLIGGQRQIDAMGPDPEVIAWKALSRGANAGAAMAALKALCSSGQTVPLTFNAYSYQVIVASFIPTYMRMNEWKYAISCEIVVDNASGAGASGVFTMLDSLVNVDMTTIQGLAAL